MNCPSHVIGGGYVDTSPPAIKCSALAPRASPVGMAWGYAVKKNIMLWALREREKIVRINRSYPHYSPPNTRKDFYLRQQQKKTQKHYFTIEPRATKPPYPHMGRVGGVNIITAYIHTPRKRGDSPKEIQSSSQGISFGEKGAGKRKIGAHPRLYVFVSAHQKF